METGPEPLLSFLWEGKNEARQAGLGLANLNTFRTLSHRGCVTPNHLPIGSLVLERLGGGNSGPGCESPVRGVVRV